MNDSTAVVVLAGGRASRFPGKLERTIDGEPMLLRTYRNARATGLPVYLAGNDALAPSLRAAIEAPVLTDRWPFGGPLRALVSACQQLDQDRIFALAADEPRVNAAVLAALADAWDDGVEAVVGEHGGRIEPLAALYRRSALLREGRAALDRGDESMLAAISGLNARCVPIAEAHFVNVNTPQDLQRARAVP